MSPPPCIPDAPPTGHAALDRWLRDAAAYLGIVAARCKTCIQRRCRECYSLEARLLAARLGEIAAGRAPDPDRERDALDRAVLSAVTVRSRVRGDKLEVPGLRGKQKRDYLMGMVRRGLLATDYLVSGPSLHASAYYFLPPTATQNTTQQPPQP